MTVPQETAPSGAGTDTASTRPSAADAGLRTDEEHACNLTEIAGSPLLALPPGFRARCRGWRQISHVLPSWRIRGRTTGGQAGLGRAAMICVEPGRVGRYCLCRC